MIIQQRYNFVNTFFKKILQIYFFCVILPLGGDFLKNRIKSIRKHCNLTQAEFGSRLGVTQASVAGWEAGLRNPLEPAIALICREFNVNESWLRTGDGEMFRPVDREAELFRWVGTVLADESDSFRRRFLNLLANLTPEEWQAMERYARALVSPTDPTDP